MEPIIIKVQVEVGVNKQLQGFISAVLENLYGPQPKVAVVAQEVAKPAPEAPAVAETKNEAAQEPPVATEQAEEAVKEYTEVDVRAAMDQARRRIEGEDYKEKPGSEGYKKWHKKLSAYFKQIAAELGAEKPSAIPDSESRGKFIARCAAIIVAGSGEELTEDLPF